MGTLQGRTQRRMRAALWASSPSRHSFTLPAPAKHPLSLSSGDQSQPALKALLSWSLGMEPSQPPAGGTCPHLTSGMQLEMWFL